MQFDLTQKRVQALAKTLRRELGDGVDHRAMLDALAKGFGYKSYAALKAALPRDTASHESATATEVRAEGVSPAPADRPAIARIGYAVLPDGYAVQAYDDDNQPIDGLAVREGNAGGDSVSRIAPDAPSAQTPEWLFVQARKDALRLARAHGVPDGRVFEDTDLEVEAGFEADPENRDETPSNGLLDAPRTFEVTFTPSPAALGVTVIIDAADHADFRRQLLQAESRMIDTINNAFDRIGVLRLPAAGDYGIHLQLAEPGDVVDIYES